MRTIAESGNFRIKRHYSIVGHGVDTVELRWGVWNPVSFTITDETESGHLYNVVRRLDGSTPLAQLAADEGISRSDLEALVDHLVELEVVEDEPASALDHYLDTAVPTRRAASPSPAVSGIILIGDSELAGQVERILAASVDPASVSVVDGQDAASASIFGSDSDWLRDPLDFEERLKVFEPWKGALVLFMARTVNPVRLTAMNRVALAANIPWIHAVIDGPFLIVGPTIVPGRSACFECFETRIMSNARESAGYQRYKNALAEKAVADPAQPALSAVGSVLAAHTALEAVNFLATGSSFTVGKALTIHLPTMEISFHDVLRAPTCPACAPSPERDDEELYLDIRTTLIA